MNGKIRGYLSTNDINCFEPLFLQNPMLDDSAVVPDDSGVVQVHVGPTMPLNKFVYSFLVEIGLRDGQSKWLHKGNIGPLCKFRRTAVAHPPKMCAPPSSYQHPGR